MSKPLSPRRRPPHIYAIDYVRLGVISSVVAIHVVSQVPTTAIGGGVLMLLHVNREIFIMISAFVLTYSYGRRPGVNWYRFWRRRYWLIGVPYVVWTAIYVVADGHPLVPVGRELATIGYYLLNGRARYQLYFLLILFQLYLVFPWLRWLLVVTRRYHGWLLAASAVCGIAFTVIVQRSIGGDGPLGFWLQNPDPWLLSYQFYILLGAVAAWHSSALLTLVERYRHWWKWLALAVAALSLVAYSLQLAGGWSIDVADTTFQPIVMLQSLTLGLWLLAAGRHWELNGAPGKRWVLRASVATFGIYLMHPLVIQLGLALMQASGLAAVMASLPAALTLGAVFVVGVPLAVVVSLIATELIHKSPLSLPLTGRLRQGPGQP